MDIYRHITMLNDLKSIRTTPLTDKTEAILSDQDILELMMEAAKQAWNAKGGKLTITPGNLRTAVAINGWDHYKQLIQ